MSFWYSILCIANITVLHSQFLALFAGVLLKRTTSAIRLTSPGRVPTCALLGIIRYMLFLIHRLYLCQVTAGKLYFLVRLMMFP
jgi:hypothetical protein